MQSKISIYLKLLKLYAILIQMFRKGEGCEDMYIETADSLADKIMKLTDSELDEVICRVNEVLSQQYPQPSESAQDQAS